MQSILSTIFISNYYAAMFQRAYNDGNVPVLPSNGNHKGNLASGKVCVFTSKSHLCAV